VASSSVSFPTWRSRRSAPVLEDAPQRAVRAATEIASELGARCALASGELVIGRGGAIGEAVTRAQRLQLQTAAGDVRLDPSTQQLVDVTRRLDSPLVGRAQELNVLASAFERSLAERSTQLVALVGQAGVGKSRLVGELVTRVEGRATVLRGRCLSYGDGITFWPVRELVREAAVDPDASAAVIAALEEPDASGADLFLAVRTLFEALGRDRPLLVVLDDLEHAEPALLDLIDFLVDWVRDVPLTLVCVGRPELLDRRTAWAGGRTGVMSVSLDALSAGECGLLLDNLLGGALDATIAERFTAAAEGNPLFLEQLVSMLIDDGLLVEEGGRWVVTRDLTHVPVPPSIQLLLAARLDRLTTDELTVLECASVEGTVFHREPLRAEVVDIDGALRSLLAKGLIRPTTATYHDDEAYRFRHLLIRDAAYSRMPKEARGRVHARFAQWIESTEAEEVLGHHLEQAYRLLAEVGKPDVELAAAAAARLESAGRRAEARGDFASGANLLGRADELHTAAGERNLALLPLRISALRLSGDVRGARAAAAEALEAARGDRTLEAHVLVELLSVRLMADPSVTLAEVAEGADEARAVFDEVGDDRGRARANALLGDVSLFQCRFAEAEEAYERALEYARRADDDQACARAHGKLAQAAFLGPRPVDKSIARCEQILEQPDADPSAKSFALAVLGVLEAMLGNVEDGRARIEQASALADEFGLGRALALVPGFSGCVELLAGDPARAELELRAGYETLTALGETAVLATTAALLAHALVAQGRVDEAAALAKDNEATVGSGDLVSRIYWAQALSRITSDERYAREATELAADTDMLAVRAAALLDLAAVLPDGDERESAIRLARELFQAKGQRAMTSM
jgi:tetratricopeptide (TPR) repeat protein